MRDKYQGVKGGENISKKLQTFGKWSRGATVNKTCKKSGMI